MYVAHSFLKVRWSKASMPSTSIPAPHSTYMSKSMHAHWVLRNSQPDYTQWSPHYCTPPSFHLISFKAMPTELLKDHFLWSWDYCTPRPSMQGHAHWAVIRPVQLSGDQTFLSDPQAIARCAYAPSAPHLVYPTLSRTYMYGCNKLFLLWTGKRQMEMEWTCILNMLYYTNVGLFWE